MLSRSITPRTIRWSAPSARRRAPTASLFRPAALAGAIDGMSAIALESLVVDPHRGMPRRRPGVRRQANSAGLTTQTGGHDVLERSGRLDFAGSALRCDTTSVMLAGFYNDKAVPPQARPRFSKAWLAPVQPGGAALPVRFVFDADLLGDIVVDLDHVVTDRDAACAWTPAEAK